MKEKDRKPVVDNTKIIHIDVNEEVKKSFISYAMAVNVTRAIPDVRDGLKPVHRRILYAMGELNLYNDKPYRKSARIVGDVLGKYHPHGDSSVYGALVRLAQSFSIRCPLVDGQGNFGSIDGDPPAAQRYTEARLSKIASEMLRDINKDTVDWYPNFDDSLEQPCVLPAHFPNLLVNGSDGIAVGMATNIPPHNLGEVIDGVVALIDNPEITSEELIQYIPAPDFPTGGLIMGRKGIRQAYLTGRGGYIVRAKTEIEEFIRGGSERQRIVVTQLPYQVIKEDLIKKIADLVRDKRIEGISDINDESDREGMRIVIDVKRDAQAQVVLNSLYKHTELQSSNGIIFLALVHNEPKILNLRDMLYYYKEHQIEVVKRRTQYDLNKAMERCHIVEGLVKALADIDEVVRILKASADNEEAMRNLMARFDLSDKQANAILEMKLRRLTSLEVENLEKELTALENQIADYKDIIANESRVNDIIKTELIAVKEAYSTPRLSEICVDFSEIGAGDLIDREDVVISMTHKGYVKRLPVAEYKAQHRGGMGITAHKTKEEDFVERMFVTCTHDDLMFFSNKGKVYVIKAYELPEGERTARGRAVVNLLQIEQDEKINAIIPIKEGAERDGFLIMATKNGLIKKTAFEEFASIRKGGKIAITLNEGDELIGVEQVYEGDDVIMAASSGKCIRFGEDNVRATGRTSMGVKSINIDGDDKVVDMAVIRKDSTQEILTISEYGYGKRSDIDDYRSQSRAGKGVKAGKFNEQTGKLVNLKLIDTNCDVMIIADNGIIMRVKAEEISKISRDTKGVRIMTLKNEGKIVCVSVTQREEESEDVITENSEFQAQDLNEEIVEKTSDTENE